MHHESAVFEQVEELSSTVKTHCLGEHVAAFSVPFPVKDSTARYGKS